jgi:hypothetical protein
MTELKSELKAAMMEMLSEWLNKPTETGTTGFGSWASIATAQRVFIQSRDGMLWYTRTKDSSGKEVNHPVEAEQYTGRVVAVNTYIGNKEDSNPKLLITMADEAGQLTEFSVGLSNTATGQYTNIAKNFLQIIKAWDSPSLLSFCPVEGTKTDRKVVFLKAAIDGQLFYGETVGPIDWAGAVQSTLDRFGGSHSIVGSANDGGVSDEQPRPSAPASTPKPVSSPAPASALSKKMSDTAWMNLKTFGNSTPEGLKYNRQAIQNWCQENYGQPDPRQIPAADQKMALFNAEKMLHDAYYPPAEVEPEEVTEEEQQFFAGQFDDDF